MADPTVIQVLQATQKSIYVNTVVGALVAYDQALSFSQEVDFIWNRNWSFMTALYVIARYSGSLSTIGLAASYMRINSIYSGFDVNMFLPITWAQNIFLLTMQAILVIRVYALFNRSKKVLIFLATFYVLQAVAVFVTTALQFNDQALHKFVASIGTLMGSATQNINVSTSTFLHFAQDSAILPVIFDGVLLLFALWAFVRHAAEAKTLEGGWSINVLVRMLLADHLMYFVCYLTWMSLTLAMSYVTELNVSITLLDDVSNVFSALAVVAGPRMVISLRAQEYKTRREGCGLVTLESELSTIHFGAREPPTHWQSQSVVEEGGGFRAADENVQID